jgi:hypothetical protein
MQKTQAHHYHQFLNVQIHEINKKNHFSGVKTGFKANATLMK